MSDTINIEPIEKMRPRFKSVLAKPLTEDDLKRPPPDENIFDFDDGISLIIGIYPVVYGGPPGLCVSICARDQRGKDQVRKLLPDVPDADQDDVAISGAVVAVVGLHLKRLAPDWPEYTEAFVEHDKKRGGFNVTFPLSVLAERT